MEKLKRYTEDDGAEWCRSEDVRNLEEENEWLEDRCKELQYVIDCMRGDTYGN